MYCRYFSAFRMILSPTSMSSEKLNPPLHPPLPTLTSPDSSSKRSKVILLCSHCCFFLVRTSFSTLDLKKILFLPNFGCDMFLFSMEKITESHVGSFTSFMVVQRTLAPHPVTVMFNMWQRFHNTHAHTSKIALFIILAFFDWFYVEANTCDKWV